MDLIEQLRNQIRGRGDDVLQAIARGVQEELISKYPGFEFTTQIRLLSSDGTSWTSPPVSSGLSINVGEFRVELVAFRVIQKYKTHKQTELVFKIYFEGDRCALMEASTYYSEEANHLTSDDGPPTFFEYEQPDMIEQLLLSVSRIDSMPK